MSKYPFRISGMINISYNFVYVKCKLLKSHSNRFIHSETCDNRGQCFKTFLSVFYEFRAFVLGKLSQPSLMFVRPGAYPRVEHNYRKGGQKEMKTRKTSRDRGMVKTLKVLLKNSCKLMLNSNMRETRLF